MAKKGQNAIRNEDGTVFQLTADAQSVAEYNARFNKLPLKPRSGYDQYWNGHGFTNPVSPRGLSPQGVGKLMAQLFEKAHAILLRGGNEAAEMQNVLAGIFAYHEIAPEIVKKSNEQSVMAEALKVVGAEKLAKFVADKGLNVDVPTATEVAEVANEPKPDSVAEITGETPEPTDEPTEPQVEAAAEDTDETADDEQPTGACPPLNSEPTEPEPVAAEAEETQVVPEATVTEDEAEEASADETPEPVAEQPATEVNQTEESGQPVAVDTAETV